MEADDTETNEENALEAEGDSVETVVRWVVQNNDQLTGWNTWVIYDEKEHADIECARRASESPPMFKNTWRVIAEK